MEAPFAPTAPEYRCAPVALMPKVVMLMLTSPLSALTVTRPLPRDAVVTAGATCAPLSATDLMIMVLELEGLPPPPQAASAIASPNMTRK